MEAWEGREQELTIVKAGQVREVQTLMVVITRQVGKNRTLPTLSQNQQPQGRSKGREMTSCRGDLFGTPRENCAAHT